MARHALQQAGKRRESRADNRSAFGRALVGVLFVGLCGHIGTSAGADAGTNAAEEFLRQQERERAQQEKFERSPDVRLQRPHDNPPDRIPTDEQPCFTIQRIELGGEAAKEFQWALSAANKPEDPAIGRCLGTRGINIVMTRIQNAIVADGYVTTRVLAAPQDLTSGTLALTVVPGRIRTIRFAEGSSNRATKWNAVPAQPGDLLNLRDIEQALENFKRVPTAEADIQITPAEAADAQPGESDVVITWKQVFPLRLNLSMDDSGSKSTGKYQGYVTVSYDNWWTLNDLFYVSFNHDLGGGDAGDRGSKGYTVHYSVPFGYWLAGITTNSYSYHQSVAGINQTYVYSGESSNSDIRLSRLIYRDAVRKTVASVRGWLRESRNYIDDTEIEVQRRRMAGWEAGLSHREFFRHAALETNLAYRVGTGALAARTAPEEAFGEGTSRSRIVSADANLNIPFTAGSQAMRYIAVLRGQWNGTPLVPQDRFSIGGRYTVRGFDGENVLVAERGWLVRNDVGLALGATGQELYLGLDYGEVAGPSADLLLGRRLAGGVLGLRGAYKQFSYDVFVGQPIDKPEGFKTASTTAGFNISLSF